LRAARKKVSVCLFTPLSAVYGTAFQRLSGGLHL